MPGRKRGGMRGVHRQCRPYIALAGQAMSDSQRKQRRHGAEASADTHERRKHPPSPCSARFSPNSQRVCVPPASVSRISRSDMSGTTALKVWASLGLKAGGSRRDHGPVMMILPGSAIRSPRREEDPSKRFSELPRNEPAAAPRGIHTASTRASPPP